MAKKKMKSADGRYEVEQKEGDLWVNMYTGAIYSWSEKIERWVATGEYEIVPMLGEFP